MASAISPTVRDMLARMVSIVGHPLVLLSLAMFAIGARDGDTGQQRSIVIGLLVFTAAVMGYSAWQVRRHRWAHVDASHAGERLTLNRFLLLALLAATATAWLSHAPRDLILALLLSVALVLAALLTRRWCKLSLHLAVAVFSACLLWHAAWWAGLATFALAACVLWSRLALARHVPRDLVAGGLAGLLAGWVFWHCAAPMAG